MYKCFNLYSVFYDKTLPLYVSLVKSGFVPFLHFFKVILFERKIIRGNKNLPLKNYIFLYICIMYYVCYSQEIKRIHYYLRFYQSFKSLEIFLISVPPKGP